MKIRNIILLVCCFLSVVVMTLPLQAQNNNTVNIECPGGVKVNSFNGNMNHHRKDLSIPGRKMDIDISFFYNSIDCSSDYGFGKGWAFKYMMKYTLDTTGVTVTRMGARRELFRGDTVTNVFLPPPGVFDSLSVYEPGKLVLITKKKIRYYFENLVHRRLTKIVEPNGNFLVFSYEDSLLTNINDAAGRSIQLEYNNGLLTSVTDAMMQPARKIEYTYDVNRQLVQVTDPLGNKQKYGYVLNGGMNALTDKNGNTVNIIYQANGAVTEVISCHAQKRISYNQEARTTYAVSVTATGNQVTTYVYDTAGNLVRQFGNCCGYNVSVEYDQYKNPVAFTDANGNRSEYTYDNKGNRTSERDPMGFTRLYTYDAVFSNLLSETDKKGQVTTYSYDVKGNLTGIQFPMGVSNSFTYFSNGDMQSFTDGNGNVRNYQYDNYGNLTLLQQPLGSTLTYTYDIRSRKLTATDAGNNTTTYTYDVLDRLLTVAYPDAFTEVNTYDPNGNLLSHKDRNNHVQSYEYDASNRKTKETNAIGGVRSFQYDENNNLVQVTNELGFTEKMSYDKFNRISLYENEIGETQQFSFDGAGNLVTRTFTNGNVVTMEYDQNRRMTKVSDLSGDIMTYTYDGNGNITSMTDANGNIRNFEFDGLNRNIRRTDANGNSSTRTYDGNGNRLTDTDRNGNAHAYAYDALDRLATVTDAAGKITSYQYDTRGNRTRMTDPRGKQDDFVFDVMNREIQHTFPDGKTTISSYDASGRIAAVTDPNGTTVQYSYDAIGRLITRDMPGANDDVFTYDLLGRMLSAVNQDATVNLTYDATGRILTETLNGKTVSYAYNDQAATQTVVYPSGFNLLRQKDPRGRITGLLEGNKVLAAFTYNTNNQPLSRNFPSTGRTINYTHDAEGRLTGIAFSGSNPMNFEYSYNREFFPEGVIKSHSPDRSEEYILDNTYQLTGFNRGQYSGGLIPAPTDQQAISYDPAGNRVSEVTNGVTKNYIVTNVNAYAQAGNSVYQYDSNGNLLGDGVNSYAYNTRNQLISVNNDSVAVYKYDALGRRISKTTSAGTVNYFYDGQSDIEGYDASGNLLFLHVYGAGIDDRIMTRSNGVTRFFFGNTTGSPLAACDSSGKWLEYYEYDPFGAVKVFDALFNPLAGSAIGNAKYFTGRDLDMETGKYYFRARHYDAELGRFMQRDPVMFDGGLNLYTYIYNNPLTFTDPMGTAPILPGDVYDEPPEGYQCNATGCGGYTGCKPFPGQDGKPGSGMCMVEEEDYRDNLKSEENSCTERIVPVEPECWGGKWLCKLMYPEPEVDIKEDGSRGMGMGVRG